MDILVTCTDGSMSRFNLERQAYALELIDGIRPSELFRQPLLRIQSGKFANIFVMNEVESIRFVTRLRTKTHEQPPAKDFRTVTEQEYHEKLEILRERYETRDRLFEPGFEVETLLTLNCVSGQVHYMEALVVLGHRIEQMMDMRNRLERLSSMIPCADGYLAINPHSIRRIGIYPSPPPSHGGGWLVD